MAINQAFLSGLYEANSNNDLPPNLEPNQEHSHSEIIIELPIEQLVNYPKSRYNRYRIHEGEKMQELTESIRHNGVLDPLVVRTIGEHQYEIISGKNRKHAAESIGYETLPCIIRELDDDEALRQLNFLNAQYRELLPSEKAYAYELEHQQSNNHGFRSDISTLYHADTKLDVQLEEPEERMTKWRYRQLTKFVNDGFLDAVDNNLIKLTASIELARLSPKSQEDVYNFFLCVVDDTIAYRDAHYIITPEITSKIKSMEERGDEITSHSLSQLFAGERKQPVGVLKLQVTKLRTSHPELSTMKPHEIEKTIDTALTEHFKRRKELQ